MTHFDDKESSTPTNIYVLAEHRLLRETLVRLFRKRSDLHIVGESSYSSSAAQDITSASPDLLLLDSLRSMHESDDFIDAIRGMLPRIRIVLFGMEEDADIFLQAVRSGANAYVLKSASAAELLDAVRAVTQGEAVCPSRFCKVLFEAVASVPSPKVAEAGMRSGLRFELTERQRQLMSLVAKGLSNKEIASNLNLSEFTVKNHIYRIMKQVDAQNRHEAVRFIRTGPWKEDHGSRASVV